MKKLVFIQFCILFLHHFKILKNCICIKNYKCDTKICTSRKSGIQDLEVGYYRVYLCYR